MTIEYPKEWGMDTALPFADDPFVLARSSCRHAMQIARDVFIEKEALQRFAASVNPETICNLPHGSMGENCNTVAADFGRVEEAANFALVFCLLQFGHGFRAALHRHCGRGASQTVTRGVRALHASGGLDAVRLRQLKAVEIHQAFALPTTPEITPLAQQFETVLRQTGSILEQLGLEDFAALCERIWKMHESAHAPAATLVGQLARHFPAFNDQGVLADGSRVVLVKKATLAIGELRRLAAAHDARYACMADWRAAVAPVDNVIPAMLVYRGVLRLSPRLHHTIHVEKALLARGTEEAELRAVALEACEQIVAATGHAVTALDLGYSLWLGGKEPEARQFARHHTQDTVFY